MENNEQIETPEVVTKTKLTPKKVIFFVLKLGLGVVAIYLIARKVDFAKVWETMKEVQVPYLVLAFITFFVSKMMAAFRINCYYKTQGIELSNSFSVKLNLYSMFYNLFVPIVGGEGYRIIWLKKQHEITTKRLITVSLLDRISGLALLLSLCFIFLNVSSIELDYKYLGLVLIPIMLGIYYIVHGKIFPSYQGAWTKVNFYSLLVQVLQVVTSFLILTALQVDSQVVDYLFVFLVSCLAYVLPFVGARELAFVYGADLMGLDKELSITVSLFFYLSMALTSLSGLYFLFFPSKLK